MALTNPEIVTMIRDIARQEAERYYKSEEYSPAALVVSSVLVAVQAVVIIQLTRAGVSEEEIYQMSTLPDIIIRQMKLVGWNVEHYL